MRSACFKLPKVSVAVGIPFKAFTLSQVVHPETFILAVIRVLHHTLAVSFSVANDAKVDCFMKSNLSIAIYLLECLDIDLVGL